MTEWTIALSLSDKETSSALHGCSPWQSLCLPGLYLIEFSAIWEINYWKQITALTVEWKAKIRHSSDNFPTPLKYLLYTRYEEYSSRDGGFIWSRIPGLCRRWTPDVWTWWWLISESSSPDHRGSVTGSSLPQMSFWGCLWMRLTFRLVEGVQQIFLPKVGGEIIPFLKGLSRVKN